ncbi:MAG: TolC family protein [Chthoniobacteraceae bacterium]
MFRHLVLTLTLALAAGAAEKPALRPTTLRLTLHKAIEMALARNFSIEVESFSPQIATERVTEEGGRFDPVFDITATRGEDTLRDVFRPRARFGETPANSAEIAADTFSGLSHFLASGVTQSSRVSTGLGGTTPWGLEYDLRLGVRNIDSLDGLSERWTGEASFSVNQPLLRGAGPSANLAQLRIARNNLLVSEWRLRQQVIDVIDDTVAAYNELHFAHENLKVARGNRSLALQLVNDNTKRMDIGVMSPLNITTARAEAAAREEAVILAARQIKDRENFLKQLITRDLESMLDISVEIAPPTTPGFAADVRAGVAEALQLRPDYRQAMLEIERRHITLAFTKNAALPRFDLSTSLHLLGIDNDLGTSLSRVPKRDESAWTVGAIFSVPIPNREGRASVAGAKLAAAQALVSLQQLEQEIVVRVDNANGSVVTARQRIASTQEARALAKESLDAGEERLRAGTGTTFEVLELQKKLAEAESAELRAHTDFNKAVSGYHRQTGTSLREHHVVLDAPRR